MLKKTASVVHRRLAACRAYLRQVNTQQLTFKRDATLRASLYKLSVLLSLLEMLPSSTAAQSILENSGRIIFKQPFLDGVAGNVHVPLAEHKYPEDRPFNVIVWQPNPFRQDGGLVPTTWRAGEKTGFYPIEPRMQYQLGYRDVPGSSTVQIQGETVGAYITSLDLPAGSPGNKMIITPAVRFAREAALYPFQIPGNAIVNALELQVPTAQDANKPGNFTYVTPVFFFRDRKGATRISYEITLFHNALRPARLPDREQLRRTEVGSWDAPTHSFQVGNPLAPGSRLATAVQGSAMFQTLAWTGWRSFEFAITPQNFRAAIAALRQSQAGFSGSEDPADYALIEWHLNAELKFGSGPAELGWSMRRARLVLVPEQELAGLRNLGTE